MPWMSGVVLGLIATRVGLSQNSWGNDGFKIGLSQNSWGNDGFKIGLSQNSWGNGGFPPFNIL